MAERTNPRRFRRRLTAAFVLVAAVSAGFVAVATFLVAREYRQRSFRADSIEEARLALALAPTEVDVTSFEWLRSLYEARSRARILAADGEEVYSSARNLTLDDVPTSLLGVTEAQEPQVAETSVDGQPTLMVAGVGPSSTRYYLFFPLEQLRQGLGELARVLAVAWVSTTVLGAVAGRLVAVRTFRPVADTAAVAESIASGQLDARLNHVDGDEFGVLATSFNHMADEVQSLVGRLEEAAARERRFTADVAHEVRTPLTGLSTAAALMADRLTELPPTLRRPAQILASDVDRLRQLVLELLELSRLDAGADPPRLEPLRVAEAVNAVVDSAELRRNAQISVDADGAVVSSDAARLRRILSNVLDNAATHGGGVVSVTARRRDGSVEVDVIDQGPGIAGDVEIVFERFAKSDRSRAGGGSGLGLAIARQYARSMGGDVRAANEPSGGAQFTITLPAYGDSIGDRDRPATGS